MILLENHIFTYVYGIVGKFAACKLSKSIGGTTLLPSSAVGMRSDILPSPSPSEAGRRVTDLVENSGIDTTSLFVESVVHDPYGRHSAHESRHWTHAHNEWIWLGHRVA